MSKCQVVDFRIVKKIEKHADCFEPLPLRIVSATILHKAVSICCTLLLCIQTLFFFQVQVLSTSEGYVAQFTLDLDMETDEDDEQNVPTGNRSRPMNAEEEEEGSNHFDGTIVGWSASRGTLLEMEYLCPAPLSGHYSAEIQPPEYS